MDDVCHQELQEFHPNPLMQIATRLVRMYNSRAKNFGPDISSSAAWEILLQLKLAARPMTQSQISARIQRSDAFCQKYLATLIERNLVSSAVYNNSYFQLTSLGSKLLDDSLEHFGPIYYQHV